MSLPDASSGGPDTALQALGRLMVREHSMESVLRTVVELTRDVLPGTSETSVSLLMGDKALTVVSTGQLATDLDESQYGRGYGPCLESAAGQVVVEIADTAAEQRWADYCRSAAERGCRSSLSMPLSVGEGITGALNTYAREPHAFDDRARAAAAHFAPYAAVAVANTYAYQSSRDRADNLEVALGSRAVIDQAKGILMERYKLTPDEAFQALAAVSMRTHAKVRQIADHLVATGEFQLDTAG